MQPIKVPLKDDIHILYCPQLELLDFKTKASVSPLHRIVVRGIALYVM